MAYELTLVDEKYNRELYKMISNNPTRFKGRFKVIIKETLDDSIIRELVINDIFKLQNSIDAAIDLKFTPLIVGGGVQ